jgi:hypothetical protein
MAVRHDPTGVVHQGNKGGTTGCGVDTKKTQLIGSIHTKKSLAIRMAVRINFLTSCDCN